MDSAAPAQSLEQRLAQARWLSPAALTLVLLLAYLPSLSSGFLALDDPWLIEANPLYREPGFGWLTRAWTAFDFETRYALGAEYLPLRDTSHWLELRLFGLSPELMRWVSWSLYVAAALLLRAALLLTLKSRLAAELSAWIFALHPVHVESVAWLAGRKDLLALLFVAAALRVYAGRSRAAAWAVPLCMGLAYLSKSMSVVAAGLLIAQDVLARRRPDVRVVSVSVLLAAVALAVHMHVGGVVGMVTEPHGGSRWATAAAMGGVLLRYTELVAWPPALAIFHHVDAAAGWTLVSIAGYGVVLVWGALGVLWWRRGGRVVAASWLWWVVPLAPVSQVLFPLQNIMADRYLLFSVMGPALLLGVGVARLGEWTRLGARARALLPRLLGPALVSALALATAGRADTFADSVGLFFDAYRKEPGHPSSSYQLGKLFEQQGEREAAARWYVRALEVAPPEHTVSRMASNNLAILLAGSGMPDQAVQVLERARAAWPDDPKLLGNLAEITARQGKADEAKRLYEELRRRHPDYAPGRQRYERRYGEGER